MSRWLTALLLPLALAALVGAAAFAARELDPATALARAEAARHEAAMNRIAEAEAEDRARLLMPMLAVAGGVLALGLSGTLVALGAVYAYHRLRFVDVAGVSVSRQLALDGATLPAMLVTVQGHATARVEAARQPILPASIAKYTDARRELPAPRQASTSALPSPAPASLIPVAVPTWERIAASGLLGGQGDWLVGFDPGGRPVLSPGWDAWVHAAIAGLSRSGKSNTARLMLAQAQARGMRLVVLDPHAGHPDGIGHGLEDWPALLAPIAVTPGAMLEAARLVTGWLDNGGNGQETVVVVDEWTRLLDGYAPPDVREALVRAAHGVVTSGAKFGLHLCVVGQGWTVDAASHVRDGLQMAYLHKLRPDQARLVTNARPPLVDNLPTGQAYLWHQGEWQRVGLPRISADHMRAQGAQPVAQPQPQLTTDNPEVAPVAQLATVEERIRALADLGMNRTDISHQVFGHKDGGTMDTIRAVLGPVE